MTQAQVHCACFICSRYSSNHMNVFRLSHQKLEIVTIRELISDASCGAHVIFDGTVRSQSHGRNVTALEFEAYEPMVYAELEKIALEIQDRWPVQNIVLFHRLGRCEIGESPVIAAISSPHREEAFAACAWLMNRLKERVPIWKKEIFTDGEHWVSPTP